MLYAKVVLGLAVEGPFDYIVPDDFAKRIKPGVRVWVPFRNTRRLAYVVSLTYKTSIKGLKKIAELIDDYPVLDKNMLLLTKELSGYYCCSWGEAIEAALPEGLRKGRKVEFCLPAARQPGISVCEYILVQDLGGKKRWSIYLEHIKAVLNAKKSVIILLPDANAALNAKNIIESGLSSAVACLYKKEKGEIDEWVKIKTGKVNVVIGARSCVFAPVNDLGLIIIDDEQDSVYKQEQSPHYHARKAAFMRVKLEKARLILGSVSPSLESFSLAERNKIKYILLPESENSPEVKVIDTKSEYRRSKQRGNIILSRYLEDGIGESINSGGKALIFLNRKGFATFASCSTCGKIFKCPRCDINLVYHFNSNLLNCHYCNFKIEAPKICPECNSGYVKFFGTGTEKIESELSRIFVKARIKRLESRGTAMDMKDGDIFVATSAIIKQADCSFDIVGVLGIDNSLNRIDLRSSEKAFTLLLGLMSLAKRKFIIQTSLPMNNCFQALLQKDVNIFYKKELKQRKQLGFPPYKHIVLVKLRGRYEDKVKQAGILLYERLKACNESKNINILSVNPGQPPKLRGNFYWQILISSVSPQKVTKFLKTCLKTFSSSGIIVTVDVDPL